MSLDSLPQHILVRILTFSKCTWMYTDLCQLSDLRLVSKSFNNAGVKLLRQIQGVDLRDKTSLPQSSIDFKLLENLQYLDVTRQFLDYRKEIRHHSISRAGYNATILAQFSTLKNVSVFIMDLCDGLYSEDLVTLFSSWGDTLVQLQARGCPEVIGDGSCLKNLKKLRKLDLTLNYRVETQSLLGILENVEELYLYGCNKVENKVCECLPKIQMLSIGDSKIDQRGLFNLANKSPDLKSLFLGIWSFNSWDSAVMIKLEEVEHFKERRPDVNVMLMLA
eukprot:TRINITY_DN1273_c0_g1_i11.p1 TRINITY_DN1273_c0_g1~~TRINITY_DN1273_c0_g1_i11.p1  ORF type:complete len:278 (-),score=20.75 TRINITY_DN1273_c0_g1_i11:487-1320(-)